MKRARGLRAEELPRYNHCSKKVAYGSEDLANVELEERKERRALMFPGLCVYQCTVNPRHWHLGHTGTPISSRSS